MEAICIIFSISRSLFTALLFSLVVSKNQNVAETPSRQEGMLAVISMPNTYTQLHIQFVFAVQNRMSLIHPPWEEELYRYITGIVKNNKHKMIVINGVADHIHLFVGLHPTQAISSFMQVVKGESSEWINKKRFVKGKFQWQERYGAFSYGHSQVSRVCSYIMNQKEHHKKKSFRDEYKELLTKFEVPFEEQYIFREIE